MQFQTLPSSLRENNCLSHRGVAPSPFLIFISGSGSMPFISPVGQWSHSSSWPIIFYILYTPGGTDGRYDLIIFTYLYNSQFKTSLEENLCSTGQTNCCCFPGNKKYIKKYKIYLHLRCIQMDIILHMLENQKYLCCQRYFAATQH